MTTEDGNIRGALIRCQSSLDACVIVGGSLIWKHPEELKKCVERGVKLRFLFPDPSGDWLVKMISSAGALIHQYSPRIMKSANFVRQLGPEVDVKWYKTAVTNWFLLVDRKMVWHKMFSLTSKTIQQYENSKQTVNYYCNLFDSLWSEAVERIDYPQSPFVESNVVLSEQNQNKKLSGLLKLLVNRFNEDELKTICFHLNVDYEVLPAVGKVGKARELINYLERRKRIADLVLVGIELRPDINWKPFKS